MAPPTHCSEYNWKLPLSTSGIERSELMRANVDVDTDRPQLLLDHRRLEPEELSVDVFA
jgi:hypothetical protein